MASAIILLLLGLQPATAVIHSLKYFYTSSSQVPNLPEFVAVGLVDELQIIYYDSNRKRAEAKQDWMNKFSEEDPRYWDYQTHLFMGTQRSMKTNIEIAEQRFNQTGGVHVVQNMLGCEWDDETGEVKGYEQIGYDGEDFLSLDLTTETWTAAKQQAVITKHKWDRDRVLIGQMKDYLTHICPDWVKKYVNHGRISLMRTVLPSVSLLQKTPSSPVRCHAAGFYPEKAEMFWRKDGVEVHDGVDKGEILPNNDGTFQMSVDLSSVPPEDWMKYECVFQLSGEKHDIITKVEKPRIRTNGGSSNMLIIPIIVVVVVLYVIAVIGFILYKKKNAKGPLSPVETSEVQEFMLSYSLKYKQPQAQL